MFGLLAISLVALVALGVAIRGRIGRMFARLNAWTPGRRGG
jgi:hypothetical protein